MWICLYTWISGIGDPGVLFTWHWKDVFPSSVMVVFWGWWLENWGLFLVRSTEKMEVENVWGWENIKDDERIQGSELSWNEIWSWKWCLLTLLWEFVLWSTNVYLRSEGRRWNVNRTGKMSVFSKMRFLFHWEEETDEETMFIKSWWVSEHER